MVERDGESKRLSAIYILGAGFSAPANLPLADDLWKEVFQRALQMTGRARKFQEDVDDYIRFKRKTDGKSLTYEQINFEEFLGHLDIEHYLQLRGSDTWSDAGNETQVIIKTLIGKILTERMPRASAIPRLYLEFAKKLQLNDTVINFNYDILLERACEAIGKPFRLVPTRYAEGEPGRIDQTSLSEVIILKLHGSIDWFDRDPFLYLQESARTDGYPDFIPTDAIFNPSNGFQVAPLVGGSRGVDDTLKEIYRLIDIERFYRNQAFFGTSSTPMLINPSTEKIVYAEKFRDFWYGKNGFGRYNSRLVIIGYSLPPHDAYAGPTGFD